jgi:hypothetical protein
MVIEGGRYPRHHHIQGRLMFIWSRVSSSRTRRDAWEEGAMIRTLVERKLWHTHHGFMGPKSRVKGWMDQG